MLFAELLKEIGAEAVVRDFKPDLDIAGIAYDSRKVAPGFIFVAIPGSKVDGHNYIAQAVEKGAVAIFCEREVEIADGVAVVRVPDCRLALAALSAGFYGHPGPKIALDWCDWYQWQDHGNESDQVVVGSKGIQDGAYWHNLQYGWG